MINRFILFCAVLGWVGAGSASAQVSARFVDIQATTAVAVVKSTFKSQEPMRLTQHLPEGRRVGEAVLLVDWKPDRAMPAGVVARFEFRRAGSDRVQTLERAYDRPVTGLQRERFGVLMPDPELDRVAAWRVQLLYRGQVLDERKSAAWR